VARESGAGRDGTFLSPFRVGYNVCYAPLERGTHTQMPNWDLADAILERLYDSRPQRVLFDDLRKGLPQFSDVQDRDWIEALKALSEAGLAEVGRISSGFQGNWGVVVNAGISSQGSQQIAELRTAEDYGNLLFQAWSEQLYADLDLIGANLREEYNVRGLLRSSCCYRAAVRLILDRLRALEEAFVTSYLCVVQERTGEGVSGLRERWLRRKADSTWEAELKRAKLNASRLCQVSGDSSDQYAPQIAELEREADALKHAIVRRLESAAIEQRFPVVATRPLDRSETELQAAQRPGREGMHNERSQSYPRAVILTALGVEYNAVRSHLTNLREETHSQGPVYEVGEFLGQAVHTWEVCIVETGAGNAPAGIQAERVIAYFRPQVALLVGVAGGLKDDVSLGDVVAATDIYGYESGKAKLAFRPRPSVGRSSSDMIHRARAEARREDWLKRVTKGVASRPTVVVKPIAAGEKVVADSRSALCRFLRSTYEAAVAVEMEGRGFLEAAYENPGVRCLVVRGISDLIDGKGEADAQGWQEIASRHAAAFAFEVLSKVKPPDGPEPDRAGTKWELSQSQSGDSAVTGGTRSVSGTRGLKRDPRIDALIKDVKLGLPVTAVEPALEIVKATDACGQNQLFDTLLNSVDISDDGDALWQALSTIERCAEVAPWLAHRKVLSRMANHPDFSVRSSSASICWSLADLAPELVPVDLLIKLSVYGEDWYVEATANAALKTMARSMPAVLGVFLMRLHSADADERAHAAHHLADVANKEPDLLDLTSWKWNSHDCESSGTEMRTTKYPRLSPKSGALPVPREKNTECE